MLRRLAVASVLLTAACAGQQKPRRRRRCRACHRRSGCASPTSRLRPGRLLPARADAAASPPTRASCVGALLSARPQVMECLVDPKNRGPAATTKVTVKTTVTDQGATHAVTGENLTPEGQPASRRCWTRACSSQPLAKGAQPVEATTTFEHEQANSPSVTFGVNEGSDFSGAVRLAQPQLVRLLRGLQATRRPPVLTAKRRQLKKAPADARRSVTFEPAGSTEGDQLAACLQPKIAALPGEADVGRAEVPATASSTSTRRRHRGRRQPAARAALLPAGAGARAARGGRGHRLRRPRQRGRGLRRGRRQVPEDQELEARRRAESKCKALVEAATAWVDRHPGAAGGGPGHLASSRS